VVQRLERVGDAHQLLFVVDHFGVGAAHDFEEAAEWKLNCTVFGRRGVALGAQSVQKAPYAALLFGFSRLSLLSLWVQATRIAPLIKIDAFWHKVGAGFLAFDVEIEPLTLLAPGTKGKIVELISNLLAC
jgi:hypothetical protein